MINRSFYDGIRFLSKATPLRLLNAVKVLGTYYLSRFTGRAFHAGLPVAISFEPTTSCNLRCPECPSGLRSFTRPTGMLEENLFKNTIDELSKHTWYLILYFQGEPLLHKGLFNLIHHAVSRNIYTATSTNGHYLTPETADRIVLSGLDRLIISIDGTTQETYSAYRKGGTLSKVLEGTAHVVESRKKHKKKTPHIIFQFLVVQPNEHQIEDVKQLAEELGVDEVGFKTAQIYDYKNGNALIPADSRYSRYKRSADGTYEIKNSMDNNCWKLWHSAVVTWDGTVVPCCFDKDAAYKMGSLTANDFRTIWKSESYKSFRASVVRSRDEIEMCKNCSEGTTVWAD